MLETMYLLIKKCGRNKLINTEMISVVLHKNKTQIADRIAKTYNFLYLSKLPA